ncbi:aminotransferase class V-fold PLP-dependent enzyme [uncultured Ruminococcus sp.]|uniref:aminotransferase class V-fold PLP-dependent enzyme n=1 Tax=uncultured Ruminococcus sp. TaxID=165186 RepID=UPI000EBCD77D|nr:SufS family cysteine desulfurase [uncultured Ruminococcus sp.]HCJ40631.1 cysteine desulfurase [Ruminococcus sp.]
MNSFTKSDFPVFQANSGLVYLDSSATQQKPLAVLERVERYYREENANPLRGLYELGVKATEAYENAREAVRKFIGAKSVREIVFTRNATESLNLIAYSWGRTNIGEGDEVLVAISEHHSDLLPWQTLCKEKGAELKYLECDKSGRYTEKALRDALSERTKLFCIAQISNVFGRLNPIKRFAEICRENGTLIVCDAAQSAPHIAVDVQKLGVDFLAFSGHKMLAPMGIGVLYGREELLESMPPFLYGGEMIDTVTRCGASFAELPHKFEAGTVNAGGAVGLHAAIDYISELGLDEIERREEKLTALAFGEMKKIPHVNIIGADDPQEHHGILTFTVDGVHPHDIAAIFDSENIAVRAGHHCAQPLFHFLEIPSAARMSLAFYNDEEDIMRFIAVLKTLRRRMGYDG